MNELSAVLQLKLTELPVQIAPRLLNERVPATAKLLGCTFRDDDPKCYTEGMDAEKTPAELRAMIAYRQSTLRLVSQVAAHSYTAPGGKHFTVADLLHAVVDFETKTRGHSKWFGGIDSHHVFFEGLRWIDGDGGGFCISRGS